MKSVAVLTLFGAAVCVASPVQVGMGAFSGNTVIANFLGFANETVVSSQLASPATYGLTFSSALGGIIAENAYAPFSGVAMSAINFQNLVQPSVTITLSFTSPVLRVGFNRMANVHPTTITTDHGSTVVATNWASGTFVGIEDLGGITSLQIVAAAGQADVARIDAVWIDPATVPEPAAWTLIGSGLGWLLVWRRRSVGGLGSLIEPGKKIVKVDDADQFGRG